MTQAYIEQRDDGYWISGTRISLDSVVYVFQRGATPESIRSSYPLLTLEQVYGAITYYLAHQTEIDTYLQAEADRAEVERQAARAADPEFYGRFDEIRASRETTHQ